MTIELDSTLAQAEVLFLSFSQIVADIDRRQAEQDLVASSAEATIRRRVISRNEDGTSYPSNAEPFADQSISSISLPVISDHLRELLNGQRLSIVR